MTKGSVVNFTIDLFYSIRKFYEQLFMTGRIRIVILGLRSMVYYKCSAHLGFFCMYCEKKSKKKSYFPINWAFSWQKEW